MKTGRHRRSVSARLIIYTLLFSSLITLGATTFQLYFDYARDVDLITERMQQVRNGYLGSISESLWAIDQEQVQVQVDGIRSLPDMEKIAVIVVGKPFAVAGHITSTNRPLKNATDRAHRV